MSMFTGRQTTTGNNININTRVYTSYSDTALVSVTAWNDKISIKMQPCVGKDVNGIRQYATENNQIITTSLTADNAISLLDGVDTKLIPDIKEGKESSVSVSMGMGENKKVLTLKYDGNDTYLIIHTGVNENGITDSDHVLTHKFNKRSWMSNYDYNNGTGDETECSSDFLNFISRIRDSHLLSGIIAHSIRYEESLRSMFGSRQGQNNNRYVDNNSYQAPTNNFNGTDMGDFLPFN